MAAVGVDEPTCRARLSGSPATAAYLSGDPVEVAEGGVALGVHDLMHVLGPADHSELCHALVSRHHELHSRPAGRHEALRGAGMAGSPRAVDRLVVRRRHRAGDTERHRTRTSPHERCLAPGRVVGKRHPRMVIGALEHCVAVVRHRLGSHHSHPRHSSVTNLHSSFSPGGNLKGCNRVLGLLVYRAVGG